jgi:predicted N-acetyltransferase YhbS
VRGVLDLLTKKGAHQVYLFSDISPEYYEKLGFRKLPPDCQKSPDLICMVWGKEVDDLVSVEKFAPPTYF